MRDEPIPSTRFPSMMKDFSLDDELDPLLKEALGWVVRLSSGAATEADARAFEAWRAQGPAHAAAFREATAFSKAVRAMDLGSAGYGDNVVAFAPRPVRSLMSRRAMLTGGGAIAASVAAAMVIQPPLGLWPSFAELAADYRTAIGERRELALADGARVDLNARSALSMLGGERGVSLVTGEAFVALPQSDTDFVVEAGGQRILSRGGRFNVRTSSLQTCVSCLAGTVAWQGGDRQQ
ncbi:MAG: FecR domain-containing protein, partial [Sphingobium sp.]